MSENLLRRTAYFARRNASDNRWSLDSPPLPGIPAGCYRPGQSKTFEEIAAKRFPLFYSRPFAVSFSVAALPRRVHSRLNSQIVITIFPKWEAVFMDSRASRACSNAKVLSITGFK